MSDNMLHWEILTKSDILISEIDSTFINDVSDIKLCYFTDGNNFYGVKDNLNFFINNEVIYLKLNQKILKYFQYKTNRYNLFNNNEDTTYFLGIETTDGNYKYKYTMSINENVYIKAEKFDNNEKIDERVIQIK
jgi:hypothetical protein|nr:MAG TPA: hypothetical protein [Caudoviricetes sp.]